VTERQRLRDLPVFLCEPVGEHSWRFWCPFCRAYHVHGAAGGEGHRVAHCLNQRSPLRDGGYFIKLDPAHKKPPSCAAWRRTMLRLWSTAEPEWQARFLTEVFGEKENPA
jgi:hypothetical protein